MKNILHILLFIYGVIIGLVLLFFLVFGFLYGFKKSWAVTKLLLVYTIVLPSQLLSPLAFIGYFFDKVILLRWITWLFMDDSRMDKNSKSGYANDYLIFIQAREKTKETFWIAFLWHIKRNRVYNLLNLFKVPKTSFKVGNNDIHNIEYISDNLYKNDKNKTKVVQDGLWVIMAGLKYIPKNPNDDIWQVNQGDIISRKTSYLGDGGMWYKVDDWFSFRYSSCKIVKLWFFGERWRTIKIGTNSSRYVITIKHQKIKAWK